MALMRTLIAAGLKRGRRSFVGIFLLMALTGAALTFTVSMYVDLNAREEAALAEIEAGDVYAVDVAANLNRDVADEIEALPEVAEARLNDALGVPVKYYRGDGTTVDKNPTSGVLSPIRPSLGPMRCTFPCRCRCLPASIKATSWK